MLYKNDNINIYFNEIRHWTKKRFVVDNRQTHLNIEYTTVYYVTALCRKKL